MRHNIYNVPQGEDKFYCNSNIIIKVLVNIINKYNSSLLTIY